MPRNPVVAIAATVALLIAGTACGTRRTHEAVVSAARGELSPAAARPVGRVMVNVGEEVHRALEPLAVRAGTALRHARGAAGEADGEQIVLVHVDGRLAVLGIRQHGLVIVGAA